jgi:hypothetical protein
VPAFTERTTLSALAHSKPEGIAMLAKYLLLVGLAWSLTALALAADPPRKVELKGTLRTGVVAIGGETTGIVLETKEGNFELQLGKQQELRELAKKLSDKPVEVTGTLEIRRGVEIPQRRIVTVTTLKEAVGK